MQNSRNGDEVYEQASLKHLASLHPRRRRRERSPTSITNQNLTANWACVPRKPVGTIWNEIAFGAGRWRCRAPMVRRLSTHMYAPSPTASEPTMNGTEPGPSRLRPCSSDDGRC